jgi:hypothetical protein
MQYESTITNISTIRPENICLAGQFNQRQVFSLYKNHVLTVNGGKLSTENTQQNGGRYEEMAIAGPVGHDDAGHNWLR